MISKTIASATIALLGLVSLTGCAALQSDAWRAGHAFGSKFNFDTYMEAFGGCQFAQPEIYPVTSNSEYEDFMDGCTSAALKDSEPLPTSSSSGNPQGGEGNFSSDGNPVAIDSSFAEDFIRSSFFESMGVWFLAECPELMSGFDGSKFTCYACPELYVAGEIGGGYFYGDGSTEFRCDAAYEGLAVDYVVLNGQMLLDNKSIRGANPGATGKDPNSATGGLGGGDLTNSAADDDLELAFVKPNISVTTSVIKAFGLHQTVSLGMGPCKTPMCIELRVIIESEPVPEDAVGVDVWITLVLRDGSGQSILERKMFLSKDGGSDGFVKNFTWFDTRDIDELYFELIEDGTVIFTGKPTLEISSSALDELMPLWVSPEGTLTSDGDISDRAGIREALFDSGVCNAEGAYGSDCRLVSADSTVLNEVWIATTAKVIRSWAIEDYFYNRSDFFADSWAIQIQYKKPNNQLFEDALSLDWDVVRVGRVRGGTQTYCLSQCIQTRGELQAILSSGTG